jgi:hypothetical protein
MNHERDSRGRRIYRETIGAAKDDPVFRSMASDVKRRAAVKRMGLRVIAGGTRDRGPFGGRAA